MLQFDSARRFGRTAGNDQVCYNRPMGEHTMSRILAVSDLSAAGDLAIVEALRHARASNASLGVVHAVPSLASIRPLFPQNVADNAVLASELPVRAEAALRHRLATLGVTESYELFLEHGTTAEGATTVIERWHPDLVVVGAPDEAFDAVRLVRHATVAILVARTSPQTGRVVAGTDFSDPSLPALNAAAEASQRMGGELVFAHAVELNPLAVYGGDPLAIMNVPALEEINEAARHRLDEAARQLGIRAKSMVCQGPPAAALVELANTLEAELLVIGTHGRTGLTRFLIGSVAERVIQRASCSVLVVRMS